MQIEMTLMIHPVKIFAEQKNKLVLERLLISVCMLVILSIHCSGQNCSCISGGKNKKDATKNWGGVVSSTDHYSLLINKITSTTDTTVPDKYYLSLSAASRILLPDSITGSKGSLLLHLADGSEVTFSGATCFNHPSGFADAIGFQVLLTEEQIKILGSNPIVSLNAFGILHTSFTSKKQGEQQQIVNCLLNRK